MNKLALILSLVGFVSGCHSGIDAASGTAACATATACGLIGGDISSCTTTIQFINDDNVAAGVHISSNQVNCIAAAGGDCSLARKCLNGGSSPAVCTGTSESCSGSTWQTCDPVTGTGGNNGSREFDCGAVHQQCIVANGNTDCGVGSCSGFLAECSGDTLKTCGDGIERDQDCGTLAATCVASGLTAHCRGKGASCSELDGAALRCDGSVLVTCVDGQEARTDCSRYNLGCFGPPPNEAGNRCGLGADCDPARAGSTCEGNVLHFCNKGKNDTVNCGANGFNGCSATAGVGVCVAKTP